MTSYSYSSVNPLQQHIQAPLMSNTQIPTGGTGNMYPGDAGRVVLGGSRNRRSNRRSSRSNRSSRRRNRSNRSRSSRKNNLIGGGGGAFYGYGGPHLNDNDPNIVYARGSYVPLTFSHNAIPSQNQNGGYRYLDTKKSVSKTKKSVSMTKKSVSKKSMSKKSVSKKSK